MAQEYGPKIVTDGLVLCLDAADKNSYPGSGTTWTDLSPSGNDGTLSTAVIGTVSSSLNVMAFDGTDDSITLADSSTLDFGTGDFSYTAWFKWERGSASDDSVGFIGKHDGSEGWYLRPTVGNNWYMVIDDGTAVELAVVMTGWDDDGWHHIAGVWDRDTTFRAYFDGAATTTTDITGADGSGINNASVLDIGGVTGGIATDYWPGSIPNVQIYNKALSAAEVSQNFNAQRSRFGV